MGEVVNLRRARKRRAADAREIEAASNRVQYGVSKTARGQAETERAAIERRFQGHRRPERDDAD
jgi:hypothetical protein